MAPIEGRDKWLICQFHTDLKLIQEDERIPVDKLGAIKTELLHLLPEVKLLANKGVAKAEYYLALAFKKDSDEYVNWMKKASQHGVVDAHYALGQHYLGKNDFNKASAYFNRVVSSSDKFLKNEVLEMLHSNPTLEKWMHQTPKQRSQFFKQSNDIDIAQTTNALDKPVFGA